MLMLFLKLQRLSIRLICLLFIDSLTGIFLESLSPLLGATWLKLSFAARSGSFSQFDPVEVIENRFFACQNKHCIVYQLMTQ